MVLEAETLMNRRRQRPNKRVSTLSSNVTKDVLLLKQRVGRKGRKRTPSLLRTASPLRDKGVSKRKRAAGSGSGSAPGLGIERATGRATKKNFFASIYIKRVFGSLSSQKGFLLVLGFLVAVLLGAYVFHSISTPGSREPEIPLPEDTSARVHLIHYVAPESEAQGSGEAGIPDVHLVDRINTFTYTIKRGETLSEIAAKHDLDVGTLISFNDIADVRRVMAGTDLTIPNVDGVPYTVRKGDTLERIAGRYHIRLESILDANDLQSAVIQPGETLFIPGGEIGEYEYKKAMGTLFVYPSLGRLTSGYGYRQDPFTGLRRMHYGIDLAEAIGTPVKATMAGTVAAVGNQPRGYGKYVVVQHRHGFQSLYGHLSTIEVRRGESIRQGEKIGQMGNTGRSTGSHLHFSLYKNNIPVNPLSGYLYK